MVRYAAENGYDSISWTPGEVQADRYDLSKQVDRIEYIPEENRLIAWTESGRTAPPAIDEKDVPVEKLEDYIGKEAAERIINNPSKKQNKRFFGDKKDTLVHELSGIDLKVGGEGMKGFYDKILPAEVNKFFNKAKYGNAKVGTVEIDTKPTLVPKKIDRFMSSENGKYNVLNKSTGKYVQSGVGLDLIFDTKESAQQYVDLHKKKGKEVWTLPITPEMKEHAMKGFWTSSKTKNALLEMAA